MKVGHDAGPAASDEMWFRGLDLSNVTPIKHIPTGVNRVRDRILPGQITVLAGRPGMGKTALACHLVHVSGPKGMSAYVTLYEEAESIIERIALRGGHPCCVFASLKGAFAVRRVLSEPSDPLMVIDYVPYDEDEDCREFFEQLKDYAQKRHSPVLVRRLVPGS